MSVRAANKDYVRRVPPTWWLKKRSYTLFMLREATALFVAGYAIFMLVLLWRATQGEDAFRGFIEGLKSPVSLVLHLLALAMAIYHTVTWFTATPKSMQLFRGEEKVPAGSIISANYVVWIAASLIVAGLAWLFSRGGGQ
jgi:fumarate reductase subunit C